MTRVEEVVRSHANPKDPHLKRYVETARTVLEWCDLAGPVLEIGGRSLDWPNYTPLRLALADLGYRVDDTGDHDLRDLLPLPDASFASVVCTEVIEHIKDQECDPRDRFVGRCMQQLLCEIRRVLRPGGRVVLTTPNGCALSNMHRAASGYTPLMYTGHVQEMSPRRVKEMLRLAELTVLTIDTRNVWEMFGMARDRVARWLEFLRDAGYHVDQLGDCVLAVAERRG